MIALRNILHEAMLDLRRRPWRSALLAATIALTLAAVEIMAEAGDASARQLAEQLTTVEARTITVRSAGGDPLPATALPPAGTTGVEAALALGPVEDVQLSGLASRPPVALREVAGADLPDRGAAGDVAVALAAPEAVVQLGLLTGASGAVETAAGVEHLVAPVDRLPPGIDPGQLWVPVDRVDEPSEIRIIVEDISAAPAMEALVGSLLADVDPDSLTIDRPSSRLATYQLVVEDAAQRRQVVTRGSLLAVGIVVTSLVLADVTGRRRDLGRKRAMGASRPVIGALVVLHVGVLAVVGLAAGGVMTVLATALGGRHWSLDQGRLLWSSVAIGCLTIVVSVGPALLASSRDPLHELRVP